MRIYQAIESLWDFMQLHHTPRVSDCIVVFCSNDTRVAQIAATLYHQEIAPKILFSGGLGRFTQDHFDHPEADIFADIAKSLGVPSGDILIENASTNSGENVAFSAQLLQSKMPSATRFTLVQKPFMERRAYATFEKQWPAPYQALHVVSQGGSFLDYLDSDVFTSSFVINAVLEDFERVKAYPTLGFLTEQVIPDNVNLAYQTLLNRFPRN
ncbi:YdcF family protein [Vibrio astriarenae]|jgi:uncharacterized SAM-binding protein YcdF (DUF218 family)